jgi:hypothetical protein
MREIRTSGSMSGDGKRSAAAWPKLPRPSSTLLSGEAMAASLRQLLGEQRKYMEGRPRLPSTLMTRTGLWWVTRAAHSGRVYGA